MKRFFLFSAIALTGQFSFSQVRTPFRLYNYDPKLINAAFAGLKNEQNYQAHYQDHGNMQFPGSPFTAFTAFSTPLRKINSGVGAFLSLYRIGAYKTYTGGILYNYQINLGNNKKLSIGTQLSYNHLEFDFSYLKLKNNDPLVDEFSRHRTSYTADFGIAYEGSNLSLGYSTQNLIQSDAKFPATANLRTHSIYASYNLAITPSISFKPSVLVVTDFNGDHFSDLNAIVELKEIFLLGGGVRFIDNHTWGTYNAGVIIAKKVQLIGVIYSGQNHTNYSSSPNNLELLLRVVIKNKTAE